MSSLERFSPLDQAAENRSDILIYSNDLGRVSVIGECLTTPSDLALGAQAVLGKEQLSLEPLQTFPGSYSIVVERGDECVVNTDPAGQFPISWRNENSRLRLATDARDLAAGELNAPYLAASILRCPELTHTQTAFRGVNRVEAGQTVYFEQGQVLKRDEATTSPDASLTFEEATDNLRHALIEAVEQRLALGRVVTSDCSGGFDSTTLALLAAERSSGGIDAFIQYRPGTCFGDLPFAQAVAREKAGLRLHEVREDISALPFSAFEDAVLGDEPGGAIIHGRFRQRFTAAKSYDSELHLLGEGGDAVLDWSQETLCDVARAGQTDHLRELCMSYARSRALNPADLSAAAKRSAHRTLVDDLRDLATFLRSPDAGDSWVPPFTWVNWPGQTVSFLTEPMRHLLGEAADRHAAELRSSDSMSMSMGMGDYASLKQVQSAGSDHRHTRLISKSLGLAADAPYLDRNVIAACLGLPASVRAIPHDYKPVLRQAFQDVIPPVLHARMSSGTYSNVMYKGFRAALPKIQSLFGDDSRLAKLDIIDLPAIRRQVERMDMGLAVAPASFQQVLEAEMWLRRLGNLAS